MKLIEKSSLQIYDVVKLCLAINIGIFVSLGMILKLLPVSLRKFLYLSFFDDDGEIQNIIDQNTNLRIEQIKNQQIIDSLNSSDNSSSTKSWLTYIFYGSVVLIFTGGILYFAMDSSQLEFVIKTTSKMFSITNTGVIESNKVVLDQTKEFTECLNSAMTEQNSSLEKLSKQMLESTRRIMNMIYNSQNKNNGVAPSTSSLFDENNSSTVTAEIIPGGGDFSPLDN